MKVLLSFAAILCLLISCKNSTSTTPSNTASYFVDWTVDGTHYHSTATYNMCGIYNKTSDALLIMGSAKNSDSTSMSLSGAIDNLKTTGSYSGIAVGSPIWVKLSWVPTSTDDYLSNDLTGANATFIISSLAGPVTGSFTAKLAAPVTTGGVITYKFVNVQGTFSVPVF